ncbi:hypothetical protein QBC40DRAFT_319686 [Triangularia verruculosa]|uniref:Zn(2)-C6 fungal-type domain-containing protein n=1 Tax=Triangularia verruculosa TaxID=2587418 RepID=A0AAN7AYA4_9PEZI|nr:hypothetical protein QBC40DRAFT_319686 [Triangularia verruculosa]
MVYYGVVSKGCQRCRQRKIKCDQQKPGCTRCHKSGLPCPGYRDLNEVIFRDESSRIIRISRRQEKKQKASVLSGSNPSTARALSPSATNILPVSVRGSADEIGANFFFAKYVFHQDPFSTSSGYQDWLAHAYRQNDRRFAPLRAAIEAAGLAGLSNLGPSPQLSIQSKRQYRDALTAVKDALSNPSHAADDATLMAVILLGLYEMINFDTWDRYHNWTTHIQGATALLDLRGREQFTRERGGQLYVQIRPQILLACMKQRSTVPPALVKATYNFQSSGIREQLHQRETRNPASICEISFRVVNLRAAVKNGTLSQKEILERALDIEADLKTWRQGLPSTWEYTTLDDTAGFDGKRHVYHNLSMAKVWNNWRTLCILVGRIMVQNEAYEVDPKLLTLRWMHDLMAEVCISASSFAEDAFALSLVQPLHIVAIQKLAPIHTRKFAVDKLRNIGLSTGVRIAVLLANDVAESLEDHCVDGQGFVEWVQG